MQEGGWIKLYRLIRQNWIWEDAEKLKWWLDILLQANHQERKVLLGNDIITVERGSFHTSIMKLSERWKADRKTVKKFLDLLEKDRMITLKTSKKGTTLKVSNYEDYQGISEGQSPNSMDNSMDNTVDNTVDKGMDNSVPIKSQQSGHKQELKNYKNDKEGEEGKEEEPNPSLSFPTPSHKKIYDETTEVAYRTWFINTVIEETDKEVILTAPNNFIRDTLGTRFKEKLYYIFRKEIVVE